VVRKRIKEGCYRRENPFYNPGHDGAVAFLQDARLITSIESEKDSGYRYSSVSIIHVLDAIDELEEMPELICVSGWWPRDHHEYLYGSINNYGYRGVSKDDIISRQERSH
jgi:hydroxymethyl cephem carbamoyltransferase